MTTQIDYQINPYFPTPPRQKLPKNYKLPNDFKGPWFARMKPAEQRSFMVGHHAGETRAKNASKRDIETYAENSQNRNVGREVNER